MILAYTEPMQSQKNLLFCQKEDSFSKQKPKYVTQVEFGRNQHGHDILLASTGIGHGIQIYFHLASTFFTLVM